MSLIEENKERRARQKQKNQENYLVLFLISFASFIMTSLILTAGDNPFEFRILWLSPFSSNEIDRFYFHYMFIFPLIFLSISILTYFFFFGKMNKVAKLEILKRKLFGAFFYGRENDFMVFGFKENIEKNLLYIQVKESDYLERKPIKENSNDNFFTFDADFKKLLGDKKDVLPLFKDENSFLDLFEIMEGYLKSFVEEIDNTPLNIFKAFKNKKVIFSRLALKEFIELSSKDYERFLLNFEKFNKSKYDNFSRYKKFDKNKAITIFRFVMLLRVIKKYMGFPSGIVESKLKDYETRRIICEFEYTNKIKVVKIIKEGKNDTKEYDDRFPAAFMQSYFSWERHSFNSEMVLKLLNRFDAIDESIVTKIEEDNISRLQENMMSE